MVGTGGTRTRRERGRRGEERRFKTCTVRKPHSGGGKSVHMVHRPLGRTRDNREGYVCSCACKGQEILYRIL